MRIGFESTTGHVYEGTGAPVFAVVPPPLLSQALVVEQLEDWKRVLRGLASDPFAWVFREDRFDPVTRVRRGRLFQPASSGQPEAILTAGHPAIENSISSIAGNGRTRSLYTYSPCTTLLNRSGGGLGSTLVIGQGSGRSAWRVIQTEVVLGDDVLVTLKALSAFGVLPDLDPATVPERAWADVAAAVGQVVDSAFRETPISVVDRCRDASAVVLSRWLVGQGADPSFLGKDLGDIAKELEIQPGAKQCAAWLAKVVARLHVRGKTNEQVSRDLRPPTTDDAELCIHALGFMLRELGWARP